MEAQLVNGHRIEFAGREHENCEKIVGKGLPMTPRRRCSCPDGSGVVAREHLHHTGRQKNECEPVRRDERQGMSTDDRATNQNWKFKLAG